ncbi:MAG TPA: hypothetical protein VFU31_16220, partial [Candidatus Binatia bacterium]|nr:hypothetical protein [Candidatus Binatia bacterium]
RQSISEYLFFTQKIVLLKFDAGGPQDLLDVQRLLSAPPAQLSIRRLKKAATLLRLGRSLEECLRIARGRD